MTSPDRDAALADLRRSQDRSFESEGIPMVLALTNEVGRMPAATDPFVRQDGRQLADKMDAYRGALVPSSRDDDLGSVISVLLSLAFLDFGRSTSTPT